jgi:hypothetical protein
LPVKSASGNIGPSQQSQRSTTCAAISARTNIAAVQQYIGIFGSGLTNRLPLCAARLGLSNNRAHSPKPCRAKSGAAHPPRAAPQDGGDLLQPLTGIAQTSFASADARAQQCNV